MRKAVVIAITILVGLTVLASYFFGATLRPTLALLFEWGLILLAAAGLMGIAHWFIPHRRKILRWQTGSGYSLIAGIAFLGTLMAGLILTPQSASYRHLILNVKIPVEASLLAVLAVSMLVASLRLIQVRGWTPMSISFLVSAIFSLILNLGWVWFPAGSLGDTILSLVKRLPLVGARGVLLGMALGGLVVGLRFLLAQDQPKGE